MYCRAGEARYEQLLNLKIFRWGMKGATHEIVPVARQVKMLFTISQQAECCPPSHVSKEVPKFHVSRVSQHGPTQLDRLIIFTLTEEPQGLKNILPYEGNMGIIYCFYLGRGGGGS